MLLKPRASSRLFPTPPSKVLLYSLLSPFLSQSLEMVLFVCSKQQANRAGFAGNDPCSELQGEGCDENVE